MEQKIDEAEFKIWLKQHYSIKIEALSPFVFSRIVNRFLKEKEIKTKSREYQRDYQPEYRMKHAKELKIKHHEYYQRPEVKARMREYMRNYQKGIIKNG